MNVVPWTLHDRIARYLRLYLAFVRFGFSRAMEFRVDFTFRIFMDLTFYAVQLGFWKLLYARFAVIGGWTEPQILIFVAGYLFADAVTMTVFANNSWWFPIFINRGDLDYYLTRPVSPLFFLMTRDVAANSFVNLVIASGILIWALAVYPEPLGLAAIAGYVALICVGVLIVAAVNFLLMIPTFWLHNSAGLREIFFQVHKYAEMPHQIFLPWMRRILLSVLPLAFLVSVPAHMLFDGYDALTLAHMAVVLVGTYAVLVGFWRMGLRAYASASS
ncbi:MAG: ABC-2 family transporter protein [Sumerlaeia bacterium]